MRLRRNSIVRLLYSLGEHRRATRAQQTLPDPVDSEQHANLLDELGVDPRDVVEPFPRLPDPDEPVQDPTTAAQGHHQQSTGEPNGPGAA